MKNISESGKEGEEDGDDVFGIQVKFCEKKLLSKIYFLAEPGYGNRI